MSAESLTRASPVPGIAIAIGAFCNALVARRTGAGTARHARHAEADAEVARREFAIEALCTAQLLVLGGRESAALDHLNEALQPVRAAGDDTLLLMMQIARLQILEQQLLSVDAAVLRREILEVAQRRGFVGPLALDTVAEVVELPAHREADRSSLPPTAEPGRAESVSAAAEAAPGPPILIRALGAFTVLVEGEPFACGRKLPHRPLALLQALIALGGRNVAATVIVDALWPDADGGCGRRALDVALLRLRRLLGPEDAVLMSGGRLSINPELCWLDTWAFERAVDETEGAAPGASPERLRGLADTLLSMYRGAFLGAEEDRPWMMSTRDRMAAKFARALASCARAFVAAGAFSDAEALYRRGLELDNLSEPLYRGLMDCCAVQGHRAEAISTYRRCRELLSIVLGTRPSDETEALYRRLNAP